MNNIEDIKKILLESNLEELKKSLDNYNIHEYDKFGNNILHYYIIHSKKLILNPQDVISEFLKRGLEIDDKQPIGQFKRSSLQMSVVLNNKDIFDLLLKKGANVNSTDINGNSSLNIAVLNYFKDFDNYGYYIIQLLKNGADPLKENVHGISPYSLANSISNNDVKKYFN